MICVLGGIICRLNKIGELFTKNKNNFFLPGLRAEKERKWLPLQSENDINLHIQGVTILFFVFYFYKIVFT